MCDDLIDHGTAIGDVMEIVERELRAVAAAKIIREGFFKRLSQLLDCR
jgi:hypothetical protein